MFSYVTSIYSSLYQCNSEIKFVIIFFSGRRPTEVTVQPWALEQREMGLLEGGGACEQRSQSGGSREGSEFREAGCRGAWAPGEGRELIGQRKP